MWSELVFRANHFNSPPEFISLCLIIYLFDANVPLLAPEIKH